MSESVIAFFIVFSVTAVLSIIYFFLLDNMIKNHPDYKGEDFLNWDKEQEDERRNKR